MSLPRIRLRSAPASSHTVYGRVPGAQNAHVGTYSDTIVVTLTF